MDEKVPAWRNPSNVLSKYQIKLKVLKMYFPSEVEWSIQMLMKKLPYPMDQHPLNCSGLSTVPVNIHLFRMHKNQYPDPVFIYFVVIENNLNKRKKVSLSKWDYHQQNCSSCILMQIIEYFFQKITIY